MYINSKQRILSKSILFTAIIKMVGALLEGTSRLLIEKVSFDTPDMMDKTIWNIQMLSSVTQVIAVTVIFYLALRKLKHFMSIIPEDEQESLGYLQKEYLGKNNAALSASSVSRLLQLWAVIFVGAEIVYDFSSLMYRKFIAILMEALSYGNGMSDGTFLLLYNMTHGFKYMEILAALLLGVVMTGIFLNDKYLKLASLIVLVFFLLSFGVIQMQTLSFWGRDVGIVWTSIIYHFTETVGLVALSVYLTKRYKGL